MVAFFDTSLRNMFHYVAVHAGERSGVYAYHPGDDVGEWKVKGEKFFQNYNLIAFETTTQLKIGQEIISTCIEISSNYYRCRYQIHGHFANITDFTEWIIAQIKEVTGDDHPYTPRQGHYWTDNFKIKDWDVSIIYIQTTVKHDPRVNPWQVKFTMKGIKYVLDIDPVASRFEELYESYIMPGLEHRAAEQGETLMEDEELKSQLLPMLTKVIIMKGAEVGDFMNLAKKHPKIIDEILHGNFSSFTL